MLKKLKEIKGQAEIGIVLAVILAAAFWTAFVARREEAQDE